MKSKVFDLINSISNRWLYALVFVLTVFQFGNTINHDFAWDDVIVITENKTVQSGLSAADEFFTRSISQTLKDKYGYRPISLLSFAIQVEFFGLNPKPGHVINILLYGLLCVMLLKLIMQEFQGKYPKYLSVLIVLLFIVHPLHSEVVANIKSRDEILELLFGISGLLYSFKWLKQGEWKHLVLGLLFLLLSYLSRENGVVHIGILILYIGYYSMPLKLKLQRSLPYVGLAAFMTFILYYSLSTQKGVGDMDGVSTYLEDPILGNSFHGIEGVYGRIINTPRLLLIYAQNFLIPTNLVFYSGFNHFEVFSQIEEQAIKGILFSSILFLTGFFFRKSIPLYTIGVLVFMVCISPFLHIVFIMPDTFADRYVFAGSIGLSIMLIALLHKGIEKLGSFGKKALFIGFGGYLIFLSITTLERNKVWKNNSTLIQADIGKLDKSSKAHFFMANEYLNQYHEVPNIAVLEKVEAHLIRSIDIYPRNLAAGMKLAELYISQASFKKAIVVCNLLIKEFPKESDPYHFKGIAFYELGEFQSAVNFLAKANEIDYKMLDTYHYLLAGYIEIGQYENVVIKGNQALSYFPSDPTVVKAMANAHLSLGNLEDARLLYQPLLNTGNALYWKEFIGLLQLYDYNNEASAVYESFIASGLRF